MKRIRYAVDLGSTTIDTCLIDGGTGEALAQKSFRNRQALYGSDVINRIMTATRGPEYLAVMRDMVISDIRDALSLMLGDYNPGDLDMICICGNTTMISILLGYDLKSLGEAPFYTMLSDSVVLSSASELGMGELCCPVILSGCAGAFIGGDILAGMVYLGREREYAFDNTHISLLIDLGTNGEMVLNRQGSYYATSCACGPAFEGCTRRQRVYGATTIDAIALARRLGHLSAEGVLSGAYFDKGLDIQGVHLDMDILRQIILAKAAIVTGIHFLTKEAGICSADIDTVYLAGGFGFHMNVKSAMDIGLLPACFAGHIVTVGNTALKGACKILTEEDALAELNGLTDGRIQILQLAGREDYQEALIDNMSFMSR